ncbi:hypothetical protein D3C75_570390 [compost metagenome]
MIVDVQREFIKFINQNLLNNIKNYIEENKWANIVVLVDENKETCTIPEWMSNSSTKIVHKKYTTTKDESIYNDIELGEAEKVDDGFIYDDGKVVVDTDNAHDNFVIPKELQEISKLLTDVVLIGGAAGECLEDVEEALKYLKVKVEINKTFTYSAKDKYEDTSWSVIEKWVSV